MITVFISIAAITLALSSCNHLFYQPERKAFATAAQLDPIPVGEGFIVEPSSNNRLHYWRLGPMLEPHSAPFGTVLHFHGNAENLSSHILYSYWLSYFGFAVVAFDYSGYGQSTGSASREQTLLDAAALLAWARGQQDLPQPMFVFGQSLGGAIATAALGREARKSQPGSANPVAGLIIDSSFASYRGVARQILGRNWLTWALQYPLALTISSEDDPVGYAGELSTPLLMVHSEDDPIVAFAEGQQLFAAFGSGDKRLITLKGQSHTAAFHYGPKPHKRDLVEFLCRHSGRTTDCLAHLERVNRSCSGEGINHCRLEPMPEPKAEPEPESELGQ